MGTKNYSLLQVSCNIHKPSIIPMKLDNLRALLSSSSSSQVKPLSKELERITTLVKHVPSIIKKTCVGVLDAFVDSTFEFVDQPLLPSQSNFSPVEEIGEAVGVTTIEGKIPEDFPIGVYVRNGPNPLFGGLKSTKSMFGKSSHVWIEGEGMLHALYFVKDRRTAAWNISYKNKHVQTDTFKLEKVRKKPGFLPAIEGDSLAVVLAYLLNMLRFGEVNKYLSNTNVFEHSNKYYSIAENHLPQEIDIFSLQTLRNWNLNGSWNRPFTSHPKKAPGTGELVLMGIEPKKPYFMLGIISADGKKIVHKADLRFNRCSLCHEIGVTQRYNVVMDFPLTLDIMRLIRGGPLIKYEKEGYARIGVMPRYGDADSIRWFEVEPCCVFHIINSFEHNDEVVVIALRACKSAIPGPDFGLEKFEWFSKGFQHTKDHIDENCDEFSKDDESFLCRVCEWRLNMHTGEVKQRILTGTDFSMEFPMINHNFVGVRNKFGYTQVVGSQASSISGMAKYGGLAKLNFEDWRFETSMDGKESQDLIQVEYHMLPNNTFCSGATFVPRIGGVDEDDGWIITFVHNENTNISQVYIVDAKKFSSEAVAVISLPSRVPYGFHGAFMSLDC
ncbi:carotenoid 9,10(9',10')-cleavage dioxygenase 1-like [Ipomoea triloba]|uniref:carotenoid 9,10(9',10')-cleavage dioxygenase 1-like n=1 Tax=Ipomoea triloba TaxID=35885 RepID=UPI00125D47ED|nr:carotenoid 9,10(9',10')-cleavage dioxygenase 1-like [Ipomoea triloba]